MSPTEDIGTPDPKVLLMLADLLEQQAGMDVEAKYVCDHLDRLGKAAKQSHDYLDFLWGEHQSILDELLALGEEMSALLVEEEGPREFKGDIIIDNVIVNIEIQFQIVTRNGNSTRAINAIAIQREGKRVDIVSQNSTTLVVYEDKELIMDVAINSLGGDTMEDALRLVMVSVERWTLEHRHDNHYDLVINLLLKCNIIVHPEEKVVNPPAVLEPKVETTQITHASHTREYRAYGTTFWREGFYRTSRNGVRHWVEGHWVTR